MSKKKLSLLIVIFTILYISINWELKFYGKSEIFTHSFLPLGISPNTSKDYRKEFSLIDENGFSIVAPSLKNTLDGNIYVTNKITSYFFDKNEVIAEVINTDNSRLYVYNQLNSNSDSKPRIKQRISNTFDKGNGSYEKLKHVIINDRVINMLELLKNYITISLIVLILVYVYMSLTQQSKNK